MNVQVLLNETERVLLGKEELIKKVWMTIFAQGHILLEDVPGVGKTTLASTISKLCQLDYKRIQCTPDLLASDITGFTIYNRQTNEFVFKEGAVMANFLLVDEINRASSRTQSALLEAMQEQQVTVDSQTYRLPTPFTVIATQNPVGTIGTQPLPLAQLDRFMVKLSIGYPAREAQINMLAQLNEVKKRVEAVLTKEQLLQIQGQVDAIRVAEEIHRFITDLVEATRQHAQIQHGLSPRAAIDLLKLAKAGAFVEGKSYVTPEHVYQMWHEVAAHRLILVPEADVKVILDEIAQSVAYDKEW